MHALYAFFRLSDDIGDDETSGNNNERRGHLDAWQRQLNAALNGNYSHPVHPALHWAVERFEIPPRFFFEVLDGVRSDFDGATIRTFAELQEYCYRVASAVGLACIRVWGLKPGYSWAEAEPLAIESGYAFQLTNILRDLGEDGARGRVYLPAEDLEKFGVSAGTWAEDSNRERFQQLLNFQIERARGFYASSSRLNEMLQPRGRAIHALMSRAYSGLLERIAASGCGVLKHRTRLNRWAKVKLLAGVVRARFVPI